MNPQPSPAAPLPLFTCPRCGRSGFYARGLLAHVCRGQGFLDARRRLNEAELASVGLPKATPAAKKGDPS